MRALLPFRFRTVLLALVSLALLVCGYLNFEQRRLYTLPADGVTWDDSPQGVTAYIVARGGPGDRAGIREGDRLISIDGAPIIHAQDAARTIFELGAWSRTDYGLNRSGQDFQTYVILGPQSNAKPIRRYLELLGFLYLGIGAFVLVRRRSAPRSAQFYTFCLASFVLYTFSYTGKLNLFDWSVYWLNVAAWILQPLLFLHFCLTFPERPKWVRQRPWLIPSLYGSGTLLLALHVLVSLQFVVLPTSLSASNWLLDRIEQIYMVAGLLGGAVVLDGSRRRAQSPLIKQQLKWVTRGAFLAIVPFGVLYAAPYCLGYVPTPWMAVSVFSLAFLPLTFGYAIMHYRLMDVDIIFRRGIA
jgi:two-component system, NtrC family, sensor kinase